MPEGEYHGEVEADGDDDPISIKTQILIKGEKITVDFEGTSRQSARGINVTFNWTYADAIHALLCVFLTYKYFGKH